MLTLTPLAVAVVDLLRESNLGNPDPLGNCPGEITLGERFAAIRISVHASFHLSPVQQAKVTHCTQCSS